MSASADGAASDLASGTDEVATGTEKAPPVPVEPHAYLPVEVVDVELILPATHPTLVLQEPSAPYRVVRIPIGAAEGIAISYGLKEVPTRTPLTHELFANVLGELGVQLEVVRITDKVGEVYSAELVFSTPNGQKVVSCRPSDGVALALRQRLRAPVVVDALLIGRVGISPV